MSRKGIVAAVLLVIVVSETSFACGTSRNSKSVESTDAILLNYENTRLALLEQSDNDVRLAARGITNAARRAGEQSIAARSSELENAPDRAAARNAFAALSTEVIRYFETGGSGSLAVAYCAMEKKSWLQPVGRIGNPYVDEEMRRCGEFVTNPAASNGSFESHHH